MCGCIPKLGYYCDAACLGFREGHEQGYGDAWNAWRLQLEVLGDGSVKQSFRPTEEVFPSLAVPGRVLTHN